MSIQPSVFNPSSVAKVLVRATNWLGDAVMGLPAVRAMRQVFPHARVAVVARPWVADLYARETAIDEVIVYGIDKGLRAKREFAGQLREHSFECAILLQNAFDAALMAWMARIPVRVGYRNGSPSLLRASLAGTGVRFVRGTGTLRAGGRRSAAPSCGLPELSGRDQPPRVHRAGRRVPAFLD